MEISKKFFKKPTLEIAKKLLGKYLVNETSEGKVVGKIVETEAYLEDDEASHSFNGKTKRNEAMFGEAGNAYVYFTYGMYHCFNVVTNKKGVGEAVLIRALEPVEGVELMKKRRKVEGISKLCSGPAKLVMALGISKEHNGIGLLNGDLRVKDGEKVCKVIRCERVGISKNKDRKYRFYIEGNEFVSHRLPKVYKV